MGKFQPRVPDPATLVQLGVVAQDKVYLSRLGSFSVGDQANVVLRPRKHKSGHDSGDACLIHVPARSLDVCDL